MPAYSFSHLQFVPKILDGSKPHTIRPRRKQPTQPGDLLTLYYKQRTRDCRAICLTICKSVDPVVIYPFYDIIKINGFQLAGRRLYSLARRDGFDDVSDFMAFFKQYNQPSLLFELVEWDVERKLNVWDVDIFQKWVREMTAAERLAWLDESIGIGMALERAELVDLSELEKNHG